MQESSSGRDIFLLGGGFALLYSDICLLETFNMLSNKPSLSLHQFCGNDSLKKNLCHAKFWNQYLISLEVRTATADMTDGN